MAIASHGMGILGGDVGRYILVWGKSLCLARPCPASGCELVSRVSNRRLGTALPGLHVRKVDCPCPFTPPPTLRSAHARQVPLNPSGLPRAWPLAHHGQRRKSRELLRVVVVTLAQSSNPRVLCRSGAGGDPQHVTYRLLLTVKVPSCQWEIIHPAWIVCADTSPLRTTRQSRKTGKGQ